MAKSKDERIFINIDNKQFELTGADKEAFLLQREKDNLENSLIEAEQKAKQEARESAIKKLAEVAGLSKDELNAIL